ncbi:MAG: hypothetical protein JW836_16475, partial [Deltaproteobacteria bacterium]|nr:hypothetical protein [Deltaproteobacteria bacterium]
YQGESGGPGRQTFKAPGTQKKVLAPDKDFTGRHDFGCARATPPLYTVGDHIFPNSQAKTLTRDRKDGGYILFCKL